MIFKKKKKKSLKLATLSVPRECAKGVKISGVGEGWQSRTEKKRRERREPVSGRRAWIPVQAPTGPVFSKPVLTAGRGEAGSRWADTGVDPRKATGKKLPRILPEPPDWAPPSPHSPELGGEVSWLEGTGPIGCRRRLRCYKLQTMILS